MVDTVGKKRERETSEYLAAAERFIAAAGRRVADADEPELRRLIALHEVLEQAVATAVEGQLTRGSWATIGDAAGISRQAAFKKWGKP